MVSNMPRTLSKLEATLVSRLEQQEKDIVTLQDIMDTLDCSYEHARFLAHKLEKQHWLSRLEPGKYQFVPTSWGPDVNPLLVGSVLTESYYYSYATANHFYGFTPQIPAVVYVVTTRIKRSTEIRGIEYKFVTLKPGKFFGYTVKQVLTSEVMMAEPEKAIVDSVDKVAYAGGIAEVARVIHSARNKLVHGGEDALELTRLVDYALRMRSQALIARLGYLLEALEIPLPTQQEEKLLSGITKSKTYLGSLRKWGKEGHYNKKWQMVVNVPRERLFAETRIV